MNGVCLLLRNHSTLSTHPPTHPTGKTRNRLIKKAKTNGDDLGFLW